ncbi:hypothetical protein Clacol_001743 [Clathrus columnatus]|uniref:Mediator of RNA polymerase II transcription subunit 17 n=1 Tax=Clathrus columnatus TaxID=1419009 RepID=A0AAV5A3E8_9AGAM|nr:hypothetical protein Clacol_001743 [Clathrus columnatus]
MDEPQRLSLEKPYKDEKGRENLELVDITEDGIHVLEPRETVTQKLGENFRRIFVERGIDFFDKLKAGGLTDDEDIASTQAGTPSGEPENAEETSQNDKPMTPEELDRLRQEMLLQLHVAQGEISFARDLLAVVLSSPDQKYPEDIPKDAFSTTTVTKPSDIPSLQAFNSQLILGSKDEALRKAAASFKTASDSLERMRSRGVKYWSDALYTRSANWGLVSSPLPVGSQTAKGAEKSARDFWISFGLAECELLLYLAESKTLSKVWLASTNFKRRAMAHLTVHNSDRAPPLSFPRHQHIRMRVTLVKKDDAGKQHMFHDTYRESEDETINSRLITARNEIVDQEIFSQLIKEAATLPTASAHVSERLIAVDVAQNLELRFELHVRHTRLSLSQEQHNRSRPAQTPQLLLPVVNILQYKVFCQRIEKELRVMARMLTQAGVPNKIHFNPVGETGLQLVELLGAEERSRIGGDATLRVNKRLPQATLTITSVPQLYEILRDEVQKGFLNDICKIGETASMAKDGSWFIDQLSNKVIGRWEGVVLTCKLNFGDETHPELSATVVQIKGKLQDKIVMRYTPELSVPLLSWISDTVRTSCLS